MQSTLGPARYYILGLRSKPGLSLLHCKGLHLGPNTACSSAINRFAQTRLLPEAHVSHSSLAQLYSKIRLAQAGAHPEGHVQLNCQDREAQWREAG